MRDDRDTQPTVPSFSGCGHADMAGDSTVEVHGSHKWCSVCGASWIDKEAVIVGDAHAGVSHT